MGSLRIRDDWAIENASSLLEKVYGTFWVKPVTFIQWNTVQLLKTMSWGFPGGSVVKNPPGNAGDTGSIPDLGRSHKQWTTKPRHHNYRACALEPGSHSYWAYVLQVLKPSHPRAREAATVRSLHTITRERTPAHCNQRKAHAATETQHSQKLSYKKKKKNRWSRDQSYKGQ